MNIDVTAHKDLLGATDKGVFGRELAGAEDDSETSEEAVGVVVAVTRGASTGADKPSAENMLTMLVVVVIVMVTISISVEIGGGGEMISRRSGTTRVRQGQTSSKISAVNSILNVAKKRKLVPTSRCDMFCVA